MGAPLGLGVPTVKQGAYQQVMFQTLSFQFFEEVYQLFYVGGVKGVPANIGELLTPIGLAYWFADDGAKSGRGFLLHTDGFSLERKRP